MRITFSQPSLGAQRVACQFHARGPERPAPQRSPSLSPNCRQKLTKANNREGAVCQSFVVVSGWLLFAVTGCIPLLTQRSVVQIHHRTDTAEERG